MILTNIYFNEIMMDKMPSHISICSFDLIPGNNEWNSEKNLSIIKATKSWNVCGLNLCY